MHRGVLLIVLALAVSASRQPASADVSAVPARTPAPALSLRDASGAPIALADFKGKVVLLDFWATWCAGCKVEIPSYMEFQTKYSRRGLVSVGVAMDEEGRQKVKPYLARHPINYPIVVGDAELARRFNITALPVTLLIDRAGRIADAHAGMVVKDAWEQEIRTLLRESR
jgi:cytochrome c biogenesis protein CcmG/thiol:disulfide interchange protein DsbE